MRQKVNGKITNLLGDDDSSQVAPRRGPRKRAHAKAGAHHVHDIYVELFLRPVRVRVMLMHRLRFKAHDVAAGVKGKGVRALDRLVAENTVDVR